MAEPLDLEALSRYARYLTGDLVLGDQESHASAIEALRQLPAAVAALERIPELERDLVQARLNFKLAKDTIERRAAREAEKDARLERAERVEAAARKVDEALVVGLSSEDADGQWGTDEWGAFMDAAASLATALAPAPGRGGEGKG